MTLEAIKVAIAGLPADERNALAAWLTSQETDEWDRQMASDGKFDGMMEEAGREYSAGQWRDWPKA